MSTSDHTTKRCTECNNLYPLTDEFWRRDYRKKGVDCYRSKCKTCLYEQDRRWQLDNPEKDRIRKKTWWDTNAKEHSQNWACNQPENRDKERNRKRQWALDHADSERKRKRQYQKDNPEKERVRKRAFYQSNGHLWRKYARERRLRRVHSEGHHTQDEVTQLYNSQNGKCFHCGASISSYFEEDHWIPISKGGSDWIENIRLLCKWCNRSKGNKLPHEWCPDRYEKED